MSRNFHGQIRSNIIARTFIETPLTHPFFEDAQFNASVLAKIKLGRSGQVEDILGAIIYLASDAAAQQNRQARGMTWSTGMKQHEFESLSGILIRTPHPTPQ